MVLESILDNTFHTQARMRLLVQVIRNDRQRATETVLNDVVINKGALARLASIDTSIDGRYLTTYRADGLIVATPTGSTAYSLSAGGPVVYPTLDTIIVTPVSAHTLAIRPLVLPRHMEVSIRSEDDAERMITVDGQRGSEFARGEVLVVRRAAHQVTIVRFPGPSRNRKACTFT